MITKILVKADETKSMHFWHSLERQKRTKPSRQGKWLTAATRKWCTAHATRAQLHVIRTHFMVKKTKKGVGLKQW